MDTNKPLTVDSQEFYEICQRYRFAPITDQDTVIKAFEELKNFVLSFSRQESAPLVEAIEKSFTEQDCQCQPGKIAYLCYRHRALIAHRLSHQEKEGSDGTESS